MNKQELLDAITATGPTFERMGLRQKLTELFNSSPVPFGEPRENAAARVIALVDDIAAYIENH